MYQQQRHSMFIDVLRHGEPLGGARYRGSTDDVLSETGWQQMVTVVKQTPPWTRIVSSPLRRCAAFAQQLSDNYQLPLHIEPRFTEIHFGDWEGMNSEQIMASDAQRLTQYWSDPEHNTPPNGETLADFESRVLGAWRKTICDENCEHLLIVTHGGVLRIILSHVLALPRSALFNINVPYACLSRFKQSDTASATQLLFHNSHLP